MLIRISIVNIKEKTLQMVLEPELHTVVTRLYDDALRVFSTYVPISLSPRNAAHTCIRTNP